MHISIYTSANQIHFSSIQAVLNVSRYELSLCVAVAEQGSE